MDYEARRSRDSQRRVGAPERGRAALAGSLLDSVETDVDEDAEAAWPTEVNRRISELKGGALKTIPGLKFHRRLTAR